MPTPKASTERVSLVSVERHVLSNMLRQHIRRTTVGLNQSEFLTAVYRLDQILWQASSSFLLCGDGGSLGGYYDDNECVDDGRSEGGAESGAGGAACVHIVC